MLKLLLPLFLLCTNNAISQNTNQYIDSSRYYKNIDYTKSVQWAKLAYDDAVKKNQPIASGEGAYLIGVGNYLQGNFDAALDWYIKAEKEYDNSNYKKGSIELYSDMCILYLKIKKLDKATIVINKALAFGIELRDTTLLANAYNNKGLIYLDKVKLDSAVIFFKKSYDLTKAINDKKGMSYSLDYISSAQSDNLDYENALITLKETVQLRKEIKDKTGEAIATNNIGEVYLREKLPQQAATYFLEAIKIAHEINYSDLEMYAYDMLSQTYQLQNNYKDALEAQKKYIEISKKILDEKKNKAIEELETKYETAQKEQQIKSLKDQSTIQKLTINKNKIFLGIVFGLLLSSILIAYLLYNRNTIRQANKLQTAIIKEQDQASKGIIDAEERERKRIAGDLHDGVGQLFSTVKMNMEILLDKFLVKEPSANLLAEKTMALVNESCGEVRSIAHQIMPNALIKTGLVSAIKDFIHKIPNDKLKIAVQTNGINERLDSSTETVLYRVIQESVNNVIKHADATQLDITLLCDVTEITLTIEDNGKGFDTNDPKKPDGIGMQNMKSRIALLKGSFDVSSTIGKGTMIAIHIPLV